MLHLPEVTLCCVDTTHHALALQALERSAREIRFARTCFLTSGLPEGMQVPRGVEVCAIEPLRSREEYSQFVLKHLAPYVDTSHVLLVQWDGFVVNPDAWSDEFLGCDYLGAKWFWHADGMRVGNGGFSIRSRRLLEALQDPRVILSGAEDETIGRAFRPLLEREHGILFGSEALADRFAFEAAYPVGRPFGFHGLFNFCRVLRSDEIVAVAAWLSDATAVSPQCLQLARNCAAMGQWDAVSALSSRILAASPEHAEAQALRQRAALQASATVGRNAPCPCGSGRKYKHCHGAIEGEAAPAVAAPLRVSRAPAEVLRDALARHQRGELSAAEALYREVLAAAPDDAVALHYVGVIHLQRGQAAEALPLLQRALALRPDEPEFHNNLGLALAAQDRNGEAILAHRQAITLKPDHAVAWNNLGLVLTASNRPDEAIEAYRQALAHTPAFGQAHWNLALALLATGRYEEGWREYEWRLALPELGAANPAPNVTRWNGQIVPGATLLLTAEQGLGDAIQFVRFAEPLAAMGLRVIVEAPPQLLGLFGRARGVAQVTARDTPAPAADFHLPLLSTAGVLGVEAESIPDETPYLSVDPTQADRVGRALAAREAAFRAGVCWAGSARHANDARRSIAFERLAPLLALDDIAWFSLQHGVEVGPPLIELPLRDDLDAMAALIQALDLVITVDTSVAHLAGALGRPTWILLPFAADWRWGTTGDTTPWYPTARLFRQRTLGDWEQVVADVRSALLDRSPERRGRIGECAT